VTQFKQPLPHFLLAYKYFSYVFLVNNTITWITIFFSRRAKDQTKIQKKSLPGKIIGKARKKSKIDSVPIPTTLPYTSNKLYIWKRSTLSLTFIKFLNNHFANKANFSYATVALMPRFVNCECGNFFSYFMWTSLF
jgi:hypothetical protein